ncbi:MAG TPA: Asp-tRNA(Asn)/Glu-tRNA(Gln) amidotransferase subunit GatB [Candidatus Saccharimonadales bacterium]|nr:Asp-tRNA(Asn)/Glu-tRNA(Gln) amidotransferase subunit GatB [Candidatus Saccharimonadales bacterium]
MYKLVLGLEIHLHLKTKTKMFCGCAADIYGAEPNTHTCPVCLGLPGALPVPNGDAVKMTQLLGLALNCGLNANSRFDRKHYFYPDLPKGYQISQYKQPLCTEGFLLLDSGGKAEIERIHLEEDTAKSFHETGQTLIDFNKSGMPLVEIVTTPTFKSLEDAIDFCKKIQDIVRSLNISDADMEKGQMRLEANISMRTEEDEKANKLPAYKVEVKNINSFKFMEKAVRAEMTRQTELLEKGETPAQENRGWNEATGTTISQRSKEEAHDYRYFPEPDIPPMVFDEKYLKDLKNELPQLPDQLKMTLTSQHKLSESSANLLSGSENKILLQKFNELVAANIDPQKAANLLLNKPEFREFSTEEFLTRLKESENKVTDTTVLDEAINKVLEANPKAVADFKAGKESSIEYLLGMVMRETKGKADSTIVRELLKKSL